MKEVAREVSKMKERFKRMKERGMEKGNISKR
jgi:hypothetical protein